jgi:palmitoyltransferase
MGFLFFLCILTLFTVYGCYEVWLLECRGEVGRGFFGSVWDLAKCQPWVAFVGANALFHSFWVCTLTVCQSYQIVVLAMTTNERMNMGRYSHFHSKSARGTTFKSPFDRGCKRNAIDFVKWRIPGCCRPTQDDWYQTYSLDETESKSLLSAQEIV